MGPDLVSLEYFRSLAERLDCAGHGQRGEIVADAAEMMACSKQQVYRRLREVGWQSRRSLRTDRGDTRVSESDAKTVASYLSTSVRANGKRLMDVRTAMEIAAANDKLSAYVSPTTMLRVMRRRGLHPDQQAQPTPHITMRSLHPNHTWEFDVSVCVLFYMDDGGMGLMDERVFYKNKPENLARIATKRVLRYLVSDHYSGTVWPYYYNASGETQELLFDFLMRAMGRKDDPQDPFHGVPLQLVWDAGSANQSHLIKTFLDRLNVRHWAHIPGNPRAKGQSECGHNLVECNFEARLPYNPPRDIDGLNEMAGIWRRSWNSSRIHSRTGTTRYGLWQTIRPEQLRLLPDEAICRSLLTSKPQPRKVTGNLVVSFAIKGDGARHYSVAHIDGVRVGESVLCSVNPYRAPNIDVSIDQPNGQVERYECVPLETDQAGFFVDAPVIGERYAAKPESDIDRQRKTLAAAAYDGATTPAEIIAAKASGKAAYGGTVDAVSYLATQTRADFMRRRGTALDVPDVVPHSATPPLTPVRACQALRGLMGGAWRPEFFQTVKRWYPEGVPDTELDALAARLADIGHDGAPDKAVEAS